MEAYSIMLFSPFLFLVILLCFLFLKNYKQKLPPGPNQFQVLINLHRIAKNPHIEFQKLSKSYGPLVSFRIGSQLIVVASSPQTANEITKINDRVFSGRHLPTVHQYLLESIELSIVLSPECGESWKRLRSMCQTAIFSSSVTHKNSLIRKRKVMEMVDFIRRKEGEPVNLEELMFASLSNIISSILSSTNLLDIKGQNTDEFKVMRETVDEVMEKLIMYGVVDYLPILKSIDFWSKKKSKELYPKINMTWGRIIQERRLGRQIEHSNYSTKDLLDALIGTNEFSDHQISYALMELLVGGTNSTTTTLIWLMVELIKNKEILHKVREEIEETVEGDELSEKLLSKCQYFQACIKEILRLHVPAPVLVPHRAIETREVNNFMIPKDSRLFVNAWAIARDPEYWKDAETFKPGRFLESNIDFRGTHLEYLPFGNGQRMCPGQNLAFKNIQLIVASLVHYFDWSLPNDIDPKHIDMTDIFATTLKKEKPLILIPSLKRQNMVK